jgi:hypothetical protein
MNLIAFFCCLLLFAYPVNAQSLSTKSNVLGQKAGQFMAQKANLFNQGYQKQNPLRIGLMPWYYSTANTEWMAIEQNWLKELEQTTSTAFQLKPIKPQTEEQANENDFPRDRTKWIKLSRTQKIDLFLQAQLIQTSTEFWLNLQLIEGITGAVLASQHQQIKEPDLQSSLELAQNFLKVQADGKYPHIVDIGTGVNQGELHLETTPTNMFVALNGAPIGMSPLLLRHIPAGDYQLTVKEYNPFRYQILRVNSEPSGVEVWVNQQFKGKTPLALAPEQFITAGNYQLEFKSNNNFKANLEIQTQPEGVPFQWNDNPIVRSPITFEQLGKQSYLLKVLQNEQIQVKKEFTIAQDQQEVLLLKLEPYKYAKVLFETSEENTEIILDHENRGETPASLNLSPGLHSLELKKPRFKQISQSLSLEPGKTYSYSYLMAPKSTDTSIFLTPTGEISPRLNISSKFLGLAQYKPSPNSSSMLNASLGSLEIDYGWTQLGKFYGFFDLGISVGAYAALLQKGEEFSTMQGIGGKLQLLKESQSVPVSVAVGSYLNLDLQNPKAVGFISLSRNFFDFALHLGLQTHGMNLNVGYTGFDNWRLGFVVFANSLLGLLSTSGEEITTLYGLQAGYSF